MSVLILSKQIALRALKNKIRSNDVCYYLSDDYSALMKIRRGLDGKSCVSVLGHRFHNKIKDIEKDCLEFCHKINFKNQSEAYWGTHTASRNSASIPLLRNIVYFCCAIDILKETSVRTIFICDSFALAESLVRSLSLEGKPCALEFGWSRVVSLLNLYWKLFKNVLLFLSYTSCRYAIGLFLGNEKLLKKSEKKKYVLRSWVTKGCVSSDGKYKDRNFGELYDYLTKNGKDVWVLPLFFNLGLSVFAVIRLMAKTSYQFIFIEQYLSYFDFLRVLRDALKGFYLDLTDCTLYGFDMSLIVKESHLLNLFSPHLLMYNSDAYLLKKLSKKGIDIDHFIYPIENNVVEKPFIQAVRKFYSGAKITAFQHSVWFKEQLGMFLHPEELSYHPLPDKIICSGKRYPDVLQRAGFPLEILCLGPNLRYTAVYRKTDECSEKITDQKRALFILNFDMNQNMELLEKSIPALKKSSKVEISIKPHPLTQIGQLKKFLKNISFPDYKLAAGSVQECMKNVNIVIMSSGSVSNLETMCAGMPILRISLDNNFDFDPLWDDYPYPDLPSSEDEIVFCFQKMIQLVPQEREQLVAFGMAIKEKYFEPVSPASLKVFL